MRLPRMTLGVAAAAPLRAGRGGWAAPAAAVGPAADLSCLGDCVGPETARRCSSQCGNNMACWATCAGANADLYCLSNCFVTS